MNRAVALRIAACGIMGLGAALLIAALLLSTYTNGKIAKIPLDLDTTLVADGTGTAFDPESLNTDKFVINKNVPLVGEMLIDHGVRIADLLSDLAKRHGFITAIGKHFACSGKDFAPQPLLAL